jgi:hypothetical protein
MIRYFKHGKLNQLGHEAVQQLPNGDDWTIQRYIDFWSMWENASLFNYTGPNSTERRNCVEERVLHMLGVCPVLAWRPAKRGGLKNH